MSILKKITNHGRIKDLHCKFMVVKEWKAKLTAKIKCEMLEVNRGSCYKRLHGSVSKKDDKSVIEKIGEIYDKHKGTYGKRRITLQLRKNGYLINIKRVWRLMKKMNLKAVIRKKWRCQKYTKQHVSKNILNREFIAEKPMEKLVCDVTELRIVELLIFQRCDHITMGLYSDLK